MDNIDTLRYEGGKNVATLFIIKSIAIFLIFIFLPIFFIIVNPYGGNVEQFRNPLVIILIILIPIFAFLFVNWQDIVNYHIAILLKNSISLENYITKKRIEIPLNKIESIQETKEFRRRGGPASIISGIVAIPIIKIFHNGIISKFPWNDTNEKLDEFMGEIKRRRKTSS